MVRFALASAYLSWLLCNEAVHLHVQVEAWRPPTSNRIHNNNAARDTNTRTTNARSCKTPLQRALGKDGLIIAAALMAKNIGGGINYIAVCRSLSISAGTRRQNPNNWRGAVAFAVVAVVGVGSYSSCEEMTT